MGFANIVVVGVLSEVGLIITVFDVLVGVLILFGVFANFLEDLYKSV
jgi:hypothetical protein